VKNTAALVLAMLLFPAFGHAMGTTPSTAGIDPTTGEPSSTQTQQQTQQQLQQQQQFFQLISQMQQQQHQMGMSAVSNIR